MNSFNLWSDLKYRFKANNIIFKLIIINVIVFLIFGLTLVVYNLFGLNKETFYQFWNVFSLSAEPIEVLRKPWTIVTYMFMHSYRDFFHIIFNMLWLYWIGKIFIEYLNEKQFISTYFLSGIFGGALFILAYQAFPMLKGNGPGLGLVGASGGVVGIIIATATLLPNFSISLLFIGPVKLKYIALFSMILFILGLGGDNSGGHFAHIGGALYGFLFIKRLQQGQDIGAWFTKLVQSVRNAFSSKAGFESVKYKNVNNKSNRKEKSRTSGISGKKRYNSDNQEEIDNILDKIAQSGYESLSEKEKDTLFNASNK